MLLLCTYRLIIFLTSGRYFFCTLRKNLSDILLNYTYIPPSVSNMIYMYLVVEVDQNYDQYACNFVCAIIYCNIINFFENCFYLENIIVFSLFLNKCQQYMKFLLKFEINWSFKIHIYCHYIIQLSYLEINIKTSCTNSHWNVIKILAFKFNFVILISWISIFSDLLFKYFLSCLNCLSFVIYSAI